MLLVRSGPVNRDLGGSVHIWEDNAPVLISYFYDGAAPVEVFQNRSQSGFYMGNSFAFPFPKVHCYASFWSTATRFSSLSLFCGSSLEKYPACTLFRVLVVVFSVPVRF